MEVKAGNLEHPDRWRIRRCGSDVCRGLLAISGVVFFIWCLVLLPHYRAEFATAAAASRGQSFPDLQPDKAHHGADPMNINDLKRDE